MLDAAPAPGALFLARHGETDWNRVGRLQGHTDTELNARGREQARELGERLRGVGITRAGSSTLRRARDTAAICAGVLGVPATYEDADLRERTYGVFEGLTRDELLRDHGAAFAAWQADNRFAPDGAEPYDALMARMVAAIGRAKRVADAGGDALVLVTHGGAMRALVFAVTGTLVAPLGNGAVLRLAFESERCVGAAPLASTTAM